MAPASNPPPAGGKKILGLNLGNPGAKEYLIVGGGALGLFLVYRWWKNRQAAPATANSQGTPCTAADGSAGTMDSSGNCIGSGTTAPSTATGLSTSALLAWIQDHSSSTTTTTTTGKGTAKKVTVPPLVGSRAETAVDALKGLGLDASLSQGTPKGKTGTISAQSPKAGNVVAAGSTVRLTNKVT